MHLLAKIGVDTAENEPPEILKFGCRLTTDRGPLWPARSALPRAGCLTDNLMPEAAAPQVRVERCPSSSETQGGTFSCYLSEPLLVERKRAGAKSEQNRWTSSSPNLWSCRARKPARRRAIPSTTRSRTRTSMPTGCTTRAAGERFCKTCTTDVLPWAMT